jgi:hypothetical protein
MDKFTTITLGFWFIVALSFGCMFGLACVVLAVIFAI